MTVSQELADELHAEARDVAEQAYAPYSRFRVGAVAVTPDGVRIHGVNVENAAYPSGSCAEANAVAAAATAGHRELAVVAVAGLDGDDVTPCGNCRQVMREFTVDHVVIQDGGQAKVVELVDLLPRSFGPEQLA